MKKTYISLGRRTEKNAENRFGWKHVDFIDENETCVLVIGGNGTEDDEHANGYAKIVDGVLEKHGLKDGVSVYSVIYHNEASDEDYFMPYLLQKTSRELLMEKYHRKKMKPLSIKQADYIRQAKAMQGPDVLTERNREINMPEYVEQLFEKAVLYRISDGQKRLPFEEAVSRIRKLNIVTHCHGAYVFLKLEEMMQQKMKELGYSKQEALAIQKQLLCVAHGPYAPLGVSKSTMISFASAADQEIWHQNTFHEEVKNLNHQGKLKLSYFEGKKGEVFVAPFVTANQNIEKEHTFMNYIAPQYALSEEGRALLSFAENAIVSGVQCAKEGKLLPDVKTLVCRGRKLAEMYFDEALKNGREVYVEMLKNARIHIRNMKAGSREF